MQTIINEFLSLYYHEKSLWMAVFCMVFAFTSLGHAMTQRLDVEANFRRAASFGLKPKDGKKYGAVHSSALLNGHAHLQSLSIHTTSVEIVEEHDASHLFVVFN